MVESVFEDFIQKLKEMHVSVRLGESLKEHTTFKIGGRAAAYIIPSDAASLVKVISLCGRFNIPYMILGRGSNVLFPDRDMDMAVISVMGLDYIRQSTEAENAVTAGAGALLKNIADYAMERGLAGFEFACGIPGTLGGAIRMNAGAYGGEISTVFHSAVLLTKDKDVIKLYKDQMDFGYRRSIIEPGGYTILEAELIFGTGKPADIKAAMAVNMESRNSKQPVSLPSAGSVFKRPDIQGVYAAALIEECGLKGHCVGGARVSEKHSGFIVNTGGATAKDVRELIDCIIAVVYEKKGIKLETEIIIVE